MFRLLKFTSAAEDSSVACCLSGKGLNIIWITENLVKRCEILKLFSSFRFSNLVCMWCLSSATLRYGGAKRPSGVKHQTLLKQICLSVRFLINRLFEELRVFVAFYHGF